MNLDEKLIEATYIGQVELVRFYLESGADVNAQDSYALRWAVFNRRTDVVKLIQEHMNRQQQTNRKVV